MTITGKVKQLIKDIQKYSTSQKNLWQKIPYLACISNGKTGWSDNKTRATTQGFWALNCSIHSGYYTVYVDLETGNLVNPGSLAPAYDEAILKLALHMNELDAKALIQDMEVDEPFGSYYNAEVINKRNQSVQDDIKEYNLNPKTYKRVYSVKEF